MDSSQSNSGRQTDDKAATSMDSSQPKRDGPPALQSCSDSDSDSDSNAPPSRRAKPAKPAAAAAAEQKRQEEQAAGEAKRKADKAAAELAAAQAEKAAAQKQREEAALRHAAEVLYAAKLDGYAAGLARNLASHGLRYGPGDKVFVLVLTAPSSSSSSSSSSSGASASSSSSSSSSPSWQPATVQAVRHRLPQWPAWKTVPYHVVLSGHGAAGTAAGATCAGAAAWVASDTDRWVVSAHLDELRELRRALVEKHGVADPAPIPGSAPAIPA
jgi:hypothetical protein